MDIGKPRFQAPKLLFACTKWSKFNLSKYGHVIYHFLAFFTLINLFLRTYVSKSIDKKVTKKNQRMEQAEIIGAKIRKSLDNKLINDASIKRTEQLKSLASLHNNICKKGGERLPDPKALFYRMVTIAEENLDQFFPQIMLFSPTTCATQNSSLKWDSHKWNHSLRSTVFAAPKKISTEVRLFLQT